MHDDQEPYRPLHELLLEYEGNSTYVDILQPWLEANTNEILWLRTFAARVGDPVPPAEIEDLWRLYALSRVIELLLLRFQNGRADGCDWNGPHIELFEFEEFSKRLGFQICRPNDYTPFLHEVVEVFQAEEITQTPKITEYLWPSLMLGPMLFSRAGVRVLAGSNILLRGVADTSTLYWAYWRKNRPHEDLSHGWGHNSQWRTSFRRDYCIDNKWYLNVDGNINLAQIQKCSSTLYNTTFSERLELLVNRCFVLTQKPRSHSCPYDDFFCVDDLSSLEAMLVPQNVALPTPPSRDKQNFAPAKPHTLKIINNISNGDFESRTPHEKNERFEPAESMEDYERILKPSTMFRLLGLIFISSGVVGLLALLSDYIEYRQFNDKSIVAVATPVPVPKVYYGPSIGDSWDTLEVTYMANGKLVASKVKFSESLLELLKPGKTVKIRYLKSNPAQAVEYRDSNFLTPLVFFTYFGAVGAILIYYSFCRPEAG